MVQNKTAFVFCGVVIAHSRFGAAHELRIAEDYPRLFVPGDKAIPENPEGSRRNFAFVSEPSLGRVAAPKEPEDSERSQSEQKAQRKDSGHPFTAPSSRGNDRGNAFCVVY